MLPASPVRLLPVVIHLRVALLLAMALSHQMVPVASPRL